ncbi:MAG: O-methyltransferase [Chitinophagaceae bacterium]
MYNSVQLAAKYIHYYLRAANGKGHGIHSPFVFDFIKNVLNNENQYSPPQKIENLRKKLLDDKRILEINDPGAGSRINVSSKKTIAAITKAAVKPKKYGQLLYRITQHYMPENILELGTSLGITTAYFATANPSAQVVTIEGSKSIYDIAKKNFQLLNIKNIQLVEGNFDTILPEVLHASQKFDLAYIDGNHRYEPTMHYFQLLSKNTGNDTILIFDDICWSREMQLAWRDIQQHSMVRCTIDIFFLGFVFFRREFKEKQHFVVRF